jgi:hypothetical protein
MSLRLKTLFGSAETNLFLPARFRLEPEIGRNMETLRQGGLVSGGTVSGPRLNGQILTRFVTGNPSPNGQPGISILAEFSILTDDGAEVLMMNRGEWLGSADTLARLLANEFVSPAEHYLVGVVKFQTADSRYAWLNEGRFFSHAAAEGELMKISVYHAVGDLPNVDLNVPGAA